MTGHRFKLTIGDWSNDGHGRCETFIVISNKPVQESREAYFKAIEKLNFDISREVCSDYQEYELKPEVRKKFKKLGYTIEEEFDPEAYAKLLLFFIKQGDPELELILSPPDSLQTFHWYGFDEQRRHIGHLGYGLF